MSLACPDHGWDVGELGCKACDEKNNNSFGKATVAITTLSKNMDALNTHMLAMRYSFLVNEPVSVHTIVGSVV